MGAIEIRQSNGGSGGGDSQGGQNSGGQSNSQQTTGVATATSTYVTQTGAAATSSTNSPTSSAAPNNGESGLSSTDKGVIAGVVLGLGILGALLFALWSVRRYRRKAEEARLNKSVASPSSSEAIPFVNTTHNPNNHFETLGIPPPGQVLPYGQSYNNDPSMGGLPTYEQSQESVARPQIYSPTGGSLASYSSDFHNNNNNYIVSPLTPSPQSLGNDIPLTTFNSTSTPSTIPASAINRSPTLPLLTIPPLAQPAPLRPGQLSTPHFTQVESLSHDSQLELENEAMPYDGPFELSGSTHGISNRGSLVQRLDLYFAEIGMPHSPQSPQHPQQQQRQRPQQGQDPNTSIALNTMVRRELGPNSTPTSATSSNSQSSDRQAPRSRGAEPKGRGRGRDPRPLTRPSTSASASASASASTSSLRVEPVAYEVQGEFGTGRNKNGGRARLGIFPPRG